MEEVEVTHTEQQLPTPPEDVALPAFVMPQNLHLAGSAPPWQIDIPCFSTKL